MKIDVTVAYDPQGSNIHEYFEDATDLKPSAIPGVLATFKSKGKDYTVRIDPPPEKKA